MTKFNANSVQIEDYVEEIANKSRIKAFYPETVSRKLKIPVDIVVIELHKLVESGKLELKYQIRCLTDLNTIDTVEEYYQLIGREILCETCGEKIKVTYSNIYPIYNASAEYKEYLKKK